MPARTATVAVPLIARRSGVGVVHGACSFVLDVWVASRSGYEVTRGVVTVYVYVAPIVVPIRRMRRVLVVIVVGVVMVMCVVVVGVMRWCVVLCTY